MDQELIPPILLLILSVLLFFFLIFEATLFNKLNGFILKLKVKAELCSRRELVLELWGVTCHTGSHSVTCHPTQVNAFRINSSQYIVSWYSNYLPQTGPEGWKAELT